jgi:hypothetical protein
MHRQEDKEIGREHAHWIDEASDMDEWQALVNTVMNNRVS